MKDRNAVQVPEYFSIEVLRTMSRVIQESKPDEQWFEGWRNSTTRALKVPDKVELEAGEAKMQGVITQQVIDDTFKEVRQARAVLLQDSALLKRGMYSEWCETARIALCLGTSIPDSLIKQVVSLIANES